MADFITRIVLSGTDDPQSEKLDHAMQERFLSYTQVSVEGSVGRFPGGTPLSQNFNMTETDVRDLAAIAAAMTGCRYDVVTVCGEIAYTLSPAR